MWIRTLTEIRWQAPKAIDLTNSDDLLLLVVNLTLEQSEAAQTQVTGEGCNVIYIP